jgi:hypothetical protein
VIVDHCAGAAPEGRQSGGGGGLGHEHPLGRSGKLRQRSQEPKSVRRSINNHVLCRSDGSDLAPSP